MRAPFKDSLRRIKVVLRLRKSNSHNRNNSTDNTSINDNSSNINSGMVGGLFARHSPIGGAWLKHQRPESLAQELQTSR